jgi:PAS domain S-box-containing protein
LKKIAGIWAFTSASREQLRSRYDLMTRDTVKHFGPFQVSTMSLSSSLAEAAWVSQDQKRKELVRAELVRLLYTNADVAVSVTVVVAPLLAYFEGRIARPNILLWLLYMVAVAAARLTLARRYRRSSAISTEARRWGAAFAVGAGLAGLGWGAGTVLLYPRADSANQVILAFVLGGMMLGAAFSLAPLPEAFLAFMIPTGFSMAARFLFEGDKLHVVMGLLSAVFCIATLVTTWRVHRAVYSSLNLTLQNLGLVEAQQALRESENRFRSLFENATVGLYRTTTEGHILMANPVLLSMLGYESFDQLRERNLEEEGFEPGYSRAAFRKQLGAEGIVRGLETTWKRTDGTVLFVRESARAVRGANDSVLYYDGIVEDVTERKRAEDTRRQAEAALQESEERFRNMADTAPVMIWVTGPDKLVTFFNKTYLDFTGRTAEQELGRGWVGLVHPEDLERCSEIFHSSFDARRNFHIECRVRRADGEYRWVLCSGVPRFGPDGRFAGYIGSDIDITDLRRAQDETLARQKLESLGVLAGGIAHDFNNLLGGILINSELALAGLPVGSSAYGGLETIKSIAVRATDIVRQMMAYAGQESTAFETVNVSRLVGDMLQLLKVSISKTAILKVNLPENIPAVRGNAAQIQQVVMNLITNASEALGEKEGAISVSVTQAQVGPDSRAPSQIDYVRLEVSDTGCGMTEEVQARIFDPFFTTKFAGRGLGLAAVQGVIRNHGGIINVTSALGQGSRFEVLLPCAGQAEAAPSDISVPAPEGEVGNLAGTVLFIEDEDALCLAVSKMLRRKGLQVIEAADGKTGIDLFRASAPQIDVVLLDLTLPGMSGGEVLRELRRIQPDMKVIIMSAYSEDRVREAIGEQQPWLYIRKPYQFSELIVLVRNVWLDKMSGQAYG